VNFSENKSGLNLFTNLYESICENIILFGVNTSEVNQKNIIEMISCFKGSDLVALNIEEIGKLQSMTLKKEPDNTKTIVFLSMDTLDCLNPLTSSLIVKAKEKNIFMFLIVKSNLFNSVDSVELAKSSYSLNLMPCAS